ncbi:hypothetical protein V8C86DRAFT_3133183 [Haematococcus lacustris]
MLSKLTAAAAATRQAAPALLRSGSQDDRHATAEALLNLSARAWSLGQALKQAILMGPLVAPLWSWGTLLSQMQATEDSSSAPQPNCANALITHLCHIATDLHALVPLSLPGLVLLPSALAAERLRMCLRVSKDWALQGQLEKAEMLLSQGHRCMAAVVARLTSCPAQGATGEAAARGQQGAEAQQGQQQDGLAVRDKEEGLSDVFDLLAMRMLVLWSLGQSSLALQLGREAQGLVREHAAPLSASFARALCIELTELLLGLGSAAISRHCSGAAGAGPEGKLSGGGWAAAPGAGEEVPGSGGLEGAGVAAGLEGAGVRGRGRGGLAGLPAAVLAVLELGLEVVMQGQGCNEADIAGATGRPAQGNGKAGGREGQEDEAARKEAQDAAASGLLAQLRLRLLTWLAQAQLVAQPPAPTAALHCLDALAELGGMDRAGGAGQAGQGGGPASGSDRQQQPAVMALRVHALLLAGRLEPALTALTQLLQHPDTPLPVCLECLDQAVQQLVTPESGAAIPLPGQDTGSHALPLTHPHQPPGLQQQQQQGGGGPGGLRQGPDMLLALLPLLRGLLRKFPGNRGELTLRFLLQAAEACQEMRVLAGHTGSRQAERAEEVMDMLLMQLLVPAPPGLPDQAPADPLAAGGGDTQEGLLQHLQHMDQQEPPGGAGVQGGQGQAQGEGEGEGDGTRPPQAGAVLGGGSSSGGGGGSSGAVAKAVREAAHGLLWARAMHHFDGGQAEAASPLFQPSSRTPLPPQAALRYTSRTEQRLDCHRALALCGLALDQLDM